MQDAPALNTLIQHVLQFADNSDKKIRKNFAYNLSGFLQTLFESLEVKSAARAAQLPSMELFRQKYCDMLLEDPSTGVRKVLVSQFHEM